MGATSVSGTSGAGECGKFTTTELAIIANGPHIVLTGYVDAVETSMSPPEIGNTVNFHYPLAGGSASYVVLLTTISGGFSYVVDMEEDGDGNFTGFDFIAEAASSVMYMVAKVGIRSTQV